MGGDQSHMSLSGSQLGFPYDQYFPSLTQVPVRDSQRNSVSVPQGMAAGWEPSSELGLLEKGRFIRFELLTRDQHPLLSSHLT